MTWYIKVPPVWNCTNLFLKWSTNSNSRSVSLCAGEWAITAVLSRRDGWCISVQASRVKTRDTRTASLHPTALPSMGCTQLQLEAASIWDALAKRCLGAVKGWSHRLVLSLLVMADWILCWIQVSSHCYSNRIMELSIWCLKTVASSFDSLKPFHAEECSFWFPIWSYPGCRPDSCSHIPLPLSSFCAVRAGLGISPTWNQIWAVCPHQELWSGCLTFQGHPSLFFLSLLSFLVVISSSAHIPGLSHDVPGTSGCPFPMEMAISIAPCFPCRYTRVDFPTLCISGWLHCSHTCCFCSGLLEGISCSMLFTALSACASLLACRTSGFVKWDVLMHTIQHTNGSFCSRNLFL